MTGPMFSILIPTRNRPDTFRHSLQTVLNQPGDDFEIVVSDNASGPGTLDVIREAESPRIRYLRSDEVLPMTDNWEKGLQACTGQYVTILGDDDGLVPSSLPCARLLLSKTKARVLNWSPHTYWWPDTIVHWNKNRLIAKLGNGAHWYGASSMLKLFYDGSMGFDRLPMIYSSFVHRDCIETAVKKHGSYFCIPHVPDVVSGVINLIENDQILYSDRPLSIRGNSGKSNGTAQWARSLGGEQRESYFKDERARLQDIIHPHLVPSPNLNILIASIKLQCKDKFFPDETQFQVNISHIVAQMLATLNHDPDAYEDNLAETLALAQKHHLHIEPSGIPAKSAGLVHKKFSGPLTENGEKLERLVVNCDAIGVQNVHQAGQLADALLPHYRDAYPELA